MGKQLRRLHLLLGEVDDLSRAAGLLSWDQQTYMPKGGAEGRAMQLATMSRLAHQRFTATETGELIQGAEAETAGLDPDSDDACLVRRTGREYRKQTRVPDDWVGAFSRVTSLAHQEWIQARERADYDLFRPRLEEILRLRREYAGFFTPCDHPYDPLLDDFEPGLKTAQVVSVFRELRPRQEELARAIAEKPPIDNGFLHQRFDEQRQWDFGLEVIRAFGFDFERGRQDRSAHPFTTAFGRGDVRITTRLQPGYLGTGLFGTLHEAGHALYEQGVDPALERTPLAGGASLALHESQSRMWENLVGRSRCFWKACLPRLASAFPGQLGGVDLERFYRGINRVMPSLIRVEADEATYNLHIMIRFDLEAALITSDLDTGQLPGAWNEAYQRTLGLTPPDHAVGVLQDVHWSGGMFGYFPTYALGNLVASQLWERVRRDIPDLDRQVEGMDFSGLLAWLREHIHRHGAKFEPLDLLQRALGEGLSPRAYLDYLEEKYGELYCL
ncbi:MAG: carboxypeptidase M32 [Spirochaetota bacterium]